ncbi:MAG TPA: hypothetical protein DCE71_02370 [Parachlamydiales bacterium]|nr:hypothetical protein [Parachlamydiales bacterium]
MTDRFTELITKLGEFLQIPLFVDRHGACLLLVHEKARIQMQMDPTQTHLLIASAAIEIPPGKFRENVLKDGLKINDLPDPRPAVLGYLPLNNHLTLHQSFPIEILDAERLAAFFGAFMTEVESWIDAIQAGRTAPIVFAPESSSHPFGIR